jgi:predicted metal-dependent peptidase
MTPDMFTAQLSELNLKLLRRSPFLATIALHADVRCVEETFVAATDGKCVYLTRAFFGRGVGERLFIYAHEILHCALSHPQRRAFRDPLRWNVAADIVTNGLLAASDFEVPHDALRNTTLENLSVEEVYEQLRDEVTEVVLDLLGTGEGEAEANVTREHWQGVLQRALTLSRLTQAGKQSLGAELELALGKARVNWREVLARHLVTSQDDYNGFDTRLIHAGIYVETLASTSVKAAVHIDTSGSLDNAEMQGLFLAELKSLLNAYPGVEVVLTYGDSALYGPYELTQDTEIPPPQGGGGTSFVPFFTHHGDLDSNTPRIIFTDGYGDFPVSCDAPCLWFVTEGGLPSPRFPFGEVIRFAS